MAASIRALSQRLAHVRSKRVARDARRRGAIDAQMHWVAAVEGTVLDDQTAMRHQVDAGQLRRRAIADVEKVDVFEADVGPSRGDYPVPVAVDAHPAGRGT